MKVFTHTERVVQTREVVMDLLLARCPNTPLIKEMAAEYGLSQTTYKVREEPDDCILCGLCTRVCDHLGISAISSVNRGSGREISPPFNTAPPDCIGCLACAEICPTNCIEFTTNNRTRTIWGKTFEMLADPKGGRSVITKDQAAFFAEKTGVPESYYQTSDATQAARDGRDLPEAAGGGLMNMIYKVSVERCIACGKCELACAFAHGSEGKPATSRINIHRRGPELGTPIVCFQCDAAACVAVCPTEALVRNESTGAVEMVRERCINCRMWRGRVSLRQHAVGRHLPLRAKVRPVRRRSPLRRLLPHRRHRLGAGRGGRHPARSAGSFGAGRRVKQRR
jgi:Fe-S-cluster-containing hydrogenase component 2